MFVNLYKGFPICHLLVLQGCPGEERRLFPRNKRLLFDSEGLFPDSFLHGHGDSRTDHGIVAHRHWLVKAHLCCSGAECGEGLPAQRVRVPGNLQRFAAKQRHREQRRSDLFLRL